MKPIALPALAALIASSLLQLLPAATEAGINWERRRFEKEHMRLHDTAVNDTDRIIAVGTGGAIQYSDDDGANWTALGPPTHLDLHTVFWDGSRFIAGGGFLFESGIILTSADGLAWDKICLGASQQILCVTGNGTRTLAMGYNGTCFSTTDTSSWNGSPPSTVDYYDALWAGTQFVRVGNDGLIQTSPFGYLWNTRHPDHGEDPDEVLNGVAWNDSLLVAVGNDYDSGLPLILTSLDGITWTSQDMSALPGPGLNAVAWTGTHFVASGGTNQILTSPDGGTWSAHSAGSNTIVESLCWTGTSLIATGDGGLILTTTESAPDDPADWTFRRHGDPEPILHGFAQADVGGTNRIVIVGSHGNIFYTDDDGINGSNPASGTTWDLNDITDTTIASKRFIAVGDSGTVLTSADGATWSHPAGVTLSHLHGVTWSSSFNPPNPPHRAIAVGASGTIITGDNGAGWTTRTSGTSNTLRSVAAGSVVNPKPPHDASRLIVAVGLNGTILSSPTGTTWTTETSGTGEHLYCVIPMPGNGFLAVGGHGIVLHSANGSTWNSYSTGDAEYLYGVAWTGSQFIAVGKQGTIHTSPTGITWTRRYGRTSEDLHAAIASPTGRILAAGGQGVVITSDPAIDFADWILAQGAPPGENGPDDDPNGDGITNLVAYGHGIPAVAPSSPADLMRLPRLVDPTWGEPARIRLGVNDSNLGDLFYILDWSPDLTPGSWTEILRHTPGQECTDGEAHVYNEASGFTEIEIPETIGCLPSKFYRMRMELTP